MTISIWRYSHLALAVSSFLFILLASITGLILAFEPISDSLKPYAVRNLDQITLAETIANAQKNYDEVIEIKIEKNRFVQADVITEDGQSLKVYIDPKTGKSIANAENDNEFFQFVTTLHRSLFLHGLGRFFMGLTTFLLFLIAFTGSILVIKRQRKLSKFFSKVVRENGFQFYHVVFGRLWLIPILIISITGVFLTLNEFEVFKKPETKFQIDYDTVNSKPKIKVDEFGVFQKTKLSDVASIEFPFSDDIEDAYTLKLHDREIIVNQFTGEILAQNLSPSIKNYVDLSLDVHTGRTNVVWALVLAVASINILFFIYSGFAMTLKRRSAKTRNKFKAGQAEFAVLVGSENGSTMRFAKAFHESLLKKGQSSFFAELNDYQPFRSAKHIVVITATYGNGEAPTNAKKALAAIEKHAQTRPVHFSIVGFGSHAYPDFCQFAYDLYNRMSREENLNAFLEIRTVNDKSTDTFSEWVSEWSNKAGIDLELDLESAKAKPKKLQKFNVIEKTECEIDGSFLVKFEPKKKRAFQSGDLLNVYPANDHRERQYSIGKVANLVQLSIKRHEFGLGSTFLYDLEVGQTVEGRIVANDQFHFDPSAKQAVLISNGTGIAPFLGMIDENDAKNECHLYSGFREERSFEPYRAFIEKQTAKGKLTRLHLAYSREGEKQYVKDLLEKDAGFVASVLKDNGNVMICGSLAMQNNVLELLSKICESELKKPLSHFQANGQIKMDCY